MAWLAVNKSGNESIYPDKPHRMNSKYWYLETYDGLEINWIELPKGTIEKIINKKLTWDDEPVEIK